MIPWILVFESKSFIPDIMGTRYGSINAVAEEASNDNLSSTSHRNLIFGENEMCNLTFLYLLIGIVLSLSSGVLYTVENFVINQFEVVVSDALLVRNIIQVFIFSGIIYWNEYKLNLKWISSILQGIINLFHCYFVFLSLFKTNY